MRNRVELKAWPNDPTFHPTFIQQLLDGIIYRGGQTIQHLLDENVLRLREHGNSLDHKQINKVLSIAMATSIKRRKVAAILAILQLFDEKDCKVKRKKTRKWVRRRKEKGFFANNSMKQMYLYLLWVSLQGIRIGGVPRKPSLVYTIPQCLGLTWFF